MAVGEPVDRDLGQVVEHRQPVVVVVETLCPVGYFDQQSARLSDHQRQQVMRRDEVCVDTQPQDPQAVGEVVLPDRPIPLLRSALEDLRAPDVVDEDVYRTVLAGDTVRKPAHCGGIEVVDLHRDAGATELRDEFGGFLDRFRPVVVGLFVAGHAAAAGTDHRRSGFAERRGDASSRAARRPGHDGYAAA